MNINCTSSYYFSKQKNLDEAEETKFEALTHKSGYRSRTRDSFAKCISSDFKMCAGTPQFFKRKFPYNFPENTNSPLFVQHIDVRFIYHLVSKERFFQKPTKGSWRQ